MKAAVFMKATVLMLLLAQAGAIGGAQAADSRRFTGGTTLNACDLQNNTALDIAIDNVCIRISGGVSYSQSWGNYKTDDYGYPINGQPLVTTPGGVFTIPAPDK